jgi:hypothetical protein
MSLSTQRQLANAYPIIGLHFYQDDVAASQTDVQLLVTQVTGAAGNVVDGYVMPWAGRVIGISYDLSAAGTAGVLTIGPTVNGTEQTDPTLSVTTGTNGSDLASREAAPFTAGQRIGAEITTTSVWDATTADIAVTVWVLMEVTGVA